MTRRLSPIDRWVAVLCTAMAVSVCAPSLVRADPSDAVAQREAEGKATLAKILFQQKQFAAAAELFIQAYAIVKRPTLLYNAARSNEEAGNFASAVALYKTYRADPAIDDAGRAEANARIVRLEKILEERKRAEDSVRAEKERIERAKVAAEKEAVERAHRDQLALDKAQKEKELREKELRDRLVKLPETGAANPAHPFPVLAATATGTLTVIGGALYGAALSEAANAKALEGKLHSSADGDAYFDHVQTAITLRNAAIATAVIGAGCAAWFVWDWITPPKAMGPPNTTIIRPIAARIAPPPPLTWGWALEPTGFAVTLKF